MPYRMNHLPDNVFAPSANAEMEEEEDEEEREVEAFKRLCFHSRPQKSKIKAPELPQELKIRDPIQ